MKNARLLFALMLCLAACTPATTIPTSTATTVQPVDLPATPVPVKYLSELQPATSQVGHAFLGVGVYSWSEPDTPADLGKLLHAHGKDYPQGLLAHAPSVVTYNIGGSFALFRTEMLMQEEVSCGDGVIFRVLLDDTEVYASDPIYAKTSPIQIELNVTNARTLTLAVDARQSGDCDWSMWGNPYLIRPQYVASDYPTPSPIPPTLTPTLRPTATPDPKLPCGGIMPERVYLFIDCSDIRRIRQEIDSDDEVKKAAWAQLLSYANEYIQNFPTSLNPAQAYSGLVWKNADYPARDLALAYLITGDELYAQNTLKLLDLVRKSALRDDQYAYWPGSTPIHGLFTSPSQGGVTFQSVLFAYLAVKDKYYSTDQQKEWEAFFLAQVPNLLEYATNYINGITPDLLYDPHNWANANRRIAASSAALTILAAFQDNPRAQANLHNANVIFQQQLAVYWLPDGGWGEATDAYGATVLQAQLLLAETLRLAGMQDLYATKFGSNTLQQFCLYQLKVMTPEGVTPAMNESNFAAFDPGVLNLCALRTRDDSLAFAARKALWGYTNAFEGKYWNAYSLFDWIVWPTYQPVHDAPPDFTSTLLPSSGIAVLRSGWDPFAQYLALQFTHAYVHRDYSFGAVYLYDEGPWIVGNNYFTDDRTFPTDQHSTLTLDNGTQTRIGGDLLFFAGLDQTAAVSIQAQSYPAMNFTRTVLWYAPWHQWIIVDDALLFDAPSAHALQQRWYIRGRETSREASTWQFQNNVSQHTLIINFQPDLPAVYSPITRGYGYADDPESANGVMLEVKPQNAFTRLVTGLNLDMDGSGRPPEISRLTQGDSTLITVSRAGEELVWTIPNSFGKPGLRATPATGQASCIIKGAEITGYCIVDGKSLLWDQKSLISADRPVSLEIDLKNGRLAYSAPAASAVRLFFPAPIKSVRAGDGRVFPFEQAGEQLSLTLPAGSGSLELK